MKKIFIVLTLIVFTFSLVSCKSYLNYSPKEAEELGIKTIKENFKDALYTNILNIDNEEIYMLSTKVNKETITFKNYHDKRKHEYIFKNNEVNIYNDLNEHIALNEISKESFLNNYVGIFKIDVNDLELSNHIFNVEKSYYSVGSKTYYQMNHTFLVHNKPLISTTILNEQYQFNLEKIEFQTNSNNTPSSFILYGETTIDDKVSNIRFIISK